MGGPDEGNRASMAWALTLIVLIGVGLPVGTWLATRRLARRPFTPLEPQYGQADRWIHQQYGLDWRDCARVRGAVAQGRQVADPALTAAVGGLAGLTIAGRAPGQRRLRVVGYVELGLGMAATLAGLIGFAKHFHRPEPAVLTCYGLFLLVSGYVYFGYAPRLQRRRALRALALNQSAGGDDLVREARPPT